MPLRFFLLLCCLWLALAACSPKKPDYVPPRPHAGEKAPHSRQAVHKGHPRIDGQGVRDWFATVSFPGWRQLSIFSEFHPDEGSFVARYGKGPQVLYLSYIDNQRMSQFGLRRSARELLQAGRSSLPEGHQIKNRTWYGVQDDRPLLAVDVTKDIKLVLMGYKGLDLEDLVGLAPSLPVDKLQTMAKR